MPKNPTGSRWEAQPPAAGPRGSPESGGVSVWAAIEGASLRTLNGTIKDRAGYDDVTGRGTPKGSAFLDGLR